MPGKAEGVLNLLLMVWVLPAGVWWLSTASPPCACSSSHSTGFTCYHPPQYLCSWRESPWEEARAAISCCALARTGPGQMKVAPNHSQGTLVAEPCAITVQSPLVAPVVSYFQLVQMHPIPKTILPALLGFPVESWTGSDGLGWSPGRPDVWHCGVQHSTAGLRSRSQIPCHNSTHLMKKKVIYGGNKACFSPVRMSDETHEPHHFVLQKQRHILPTLSLL